VTPQAAGSALRTSEQLDGANPAPLVPKYEFSAVVVTTPSPTSPTQAPTVVPHRLVNLALDGVNFVLAVEPKPGDYLSDLLASGGTWEYGNIRLLASFVKDKLNRKEPCLIIDAGANQGLYSMYLAKLGCRVIAFEMQDRVAALMKHSIALNNLQDKITLISRPVYEVERSLYYVPNTSNFGGTPLYEIPTGRPDEVRVESLRIDDIVKERVDAMKMDVELSEYHALQSMSKLFDQDMVGEIIMETWGLHGDAVDFLYKYGYAGHHIHSPNSPMTHQQMHQLLRVLGKDGYKDILFKKNK